MLTNLKTSSLLICAALLLTACGDEPATNTPAAAPQDHHTDAHADHDGHTVPSTQPGDDAAAAIDDAKSAAASAGAEAASEAASEAQALLEAVTKHINDNKLELATKALAELESLRGDLPDSLNQKIDAAKAALKAAKAAAGKMDMPKLH